PDDPRLVLCYSFEGDVSTAIIDSSPNNHPGLAVNVEKAAGQAGAGARLTPESVLRVMHDDKVFSQIAETFTAAAWIAPQIEALPAKVGVVARAAHFELGLMNEGGAVRLYCRRGGDVVVTGVVDLAGWHHVACLYDG